MGVSLREVFTPLLAQVLFFARSPAAQKRSFTEIRGEIERLLEEQKVIVRREEISSQDYENARFAIVAWVDELILRYAQSVNPDLSQQWKRAPLQAELYDTANAGEEFFDIHLAQLTPAQKEVNEIYHLCLCLGFRGRYYDPAQDYKLIELRHERAQQLPVSFPDLYEIERKREHVTPQPYAVQPPPPRLYTRPPSPLWALLPILGLAAVLLYIFWPARCGNGRLDPGEQCDPSVATLSCPGGGTCRADCSCPPPRVRPREEILADAQRRIAPFQCCAVAAEDFQDGVLTLSGRVEGEAQRQEVWQAVRGVPEVTDVRDTFRLVPRPFCEVISLLEPFRTQSAGAGVNLTIQPTKQCEATYLKGEDLILDVKAQKPLQYVYIDYYVADRTNVAHILPSARQTENNLRGTSTVTIGGAGSKNRWDIEPPFGTEMVTVISSPRPLFDPPRLKPEQVAPYLEELRRSLPSAATIPDVAADYCFITTTDH